MAVSSPTASGSGHSAPTSGEEVREIRRTSCRKAKPA